jgi:hypothetical protein
MPGDVTWENQTWGNVRFTITWRNGSSGIYTGTVDQDGFLSGQTHDRWHPESKADWHMRQVVSCA